jgi:hypothetical protein
MPVAERAAIVAPIRRAAIAAPIRRAAIRPLVASHRRRVYRSGLKREGTAWYG